jgi:adenylate cyclase class 2
MQLFSGGAALRLRRARGRAILTYKGPARFSGSIKIREERETAVEDAEEIEAILAGLGFLRKFRYEKRREEWLFESCTVALDETPIGRFVEVEGEPTAIRRVVVALGLDFTEAIPYSYARLYDERRREDPSLPEDMVFAERSRLP